MRDMRRLVCCMAFVLIGLLAGGAAAELTHRVVLLNPLVPDEITLEAITRIRGELNAAGFDVVPVQHRSGAEPRDELESAARDVGALAAFAIVPSETGESAQILVLDRLRGKVLDQKMVIDRRNARRTAAILSVGAIELLKASLSEFWLSPVQSPVARPPPPPPPHETPPAQPPPPPRVAVEAGAALLTHFGDLGSVFSPMLKVGYRAAPFFAARLAVSSVGISSRIEGSQGTALVGQELATLDALFVWPTTGQVHALASAGVGAYHLRVQGIGTADTQGLSGSSWSVALTPGLGLELEIAPKLSLAVEGQLLFAVPPTTVRILSEEFGPAGDPSLVFSAGLVGNF